MAEHLVLSEAQLKGTSAGPEFLSEPTRQTLARRLGFKLEWKEWASGSCLEYAKRYNAENTYLKTLFECRREAKPVSLDPQLASLTLRSEQNHPNLPWQFSLDMTCDATPEQDLMLWVRYARIVVKIGTDGYTIAVSDRKQYPRDFPSAQRSSFTLVPGGTEQLPFWLLTAAKQPPGSISLKDLIRVESIEPDGEVEATLRVYVKDIEATTPGAAIGQRAPETLVKNVKTRSLAATAPGDARITVGAAKTMISKRLAVLELQERALVIGAAEAARNDTPQLMEGWIILARDQLRLLSVSGMVGREA